MPHSDSAVAQASPALSGCWAVAGSAGPVAAPVDHNELLEGPDIGGVGFVVVDGPGEGGGGGVVGVGDHEPVPILGTPARIAVLLTLHLCRPV